ncbi:pilus assembly protein PilM [Porticoccaceae bacterium LTM1]|nr:pilus assembly protein PilM [Porticoccaceae bacterium LTM1]
MGIFQFFDKRPKAMLGLDITSSAVKLLELSGTPGRMRVENYLVRPLPPNTVVEKNITDVNVLAESIKKLISQSHSKVRDVAVAVSGSSVITKVIEMPGGLSDQGMEANISLEADQYIPYPLDEVAIDFQVIGSSTTNPDQVDVLLAACRKENVDHRVEALELAGLHPKVVDVEVYAVERAFGLIANQMEEFGSQIVAIADIGATMLTLSVLVDGKTVYTREQLFGGRQVTEEIQRRYGLSAEEAGQAKKEGGLPEDYQSEILDPFKDALTQQISRSLQFFFSSSEYNYVDQLVLAGGVAAMEGLRDEVEEKLGLPTIVANPFAGMAVSKQVNSVALANDAPAMLVAAGLALRSFE